MAKATRKRRNVSSSKVNPVQEPVAEKQPDSAAQETTKQETKKVRTPAAHWKQTVGEGETALKRGERCNALEWPLTEPQQEALRFKMADVCVLDGRAKYKFGQKQFCAPSHYNAYMATRYTYLAGLYQDVADKYRANPDTDVWESQAQKANQKVKDLENRQDLLLALVAAMERGDLEQAAEIKQQVAALDS